jgi:hypothetical protein
MTHRFEDDGWSEDVEEPDGAEGDASIPCPYCKRRIYEDAEQCPYCRQYISEETAPAQTKPWWIIVGVCLCLFVVYHWIVS